MPSNSPLTIDGQTHKATIFAIQAQASYTKSLVFAAEARVALADRNCLWAAIASYYSLFHLSIAVIYLAPHLVEPALLAQLVRKRCAGLEDPTTLISHRQLPKFLSACEASGLKPRLRELLLNAKDIREEYANYGPRIIWKHDKPTFLTHGFRPSDVRRIAVSIPPLLRSSLRWAHKQDESSQFVILAVTVSIPWFLRNKDLHYSKWCSPKVLAEAESLMLTLPFRPMKANSKCSGPPSAPADY